MHNTLRMHIMQCLQHALGDIPRLSLRKGPLGNDPIKELATLHQFHDEETVVLIVVLLVELDNVRTVAHQFEVGDFVLQGVAVAPKHFRAVDLLDGVLLGRVLLVDANKDCCECAVAELE